MTLVTGRFVKYFHRPKGRGKKARVPECSCHMNMTPPSAYTRYLHEIQFINQIHFSRTSPPSNAQIYHFSLMEAALAQVQQSSKNSTQLPTILSLFCSPTSLSHTLSLSLPLCLSHSPSKGSSPQCLGRKRHSRHGKFRTCSFKEHE